MKQYIEVIVSSIVKRKTLAVKFQPSHVCGCVETTTSIVNNLCADPCKLRRQAAT